MARARFLLTASILFLIGHADPSHAASNDRFFWLSQINRASAVMIVERGIVPKPLGARIFDAINRVDAAADAPGATRSGDYLKVEQDLMKIIPQEKWIQFSHQLIWHGRRVCHARKPKCIECNMESLCYAKDKTI